MTAPMPSPIPRFDESDLETILLDAPTIQKRVAAIGDELNALYGEQELTIVCVLSGAMLFAADLVRCLNMPTRLDCIRAESYGNATESQGKPRITTELKNDIANRHVLLVDDILDTGRTLYAVIDDLQRYKPASVRSCVLLDKKSRHAEDCQADFTGFEIPDAFVVGYGLDFAERYRNLPSIGTLKQDFQTAHD